MIRFDIVFVTFNLAVFILDSIGRFSLKEIAIFRLNLIFSTALALLIWLTRYYKKWLHETIQLIEEYKEIIFAIFTSHRKTVKELSHTDLDSVLEFINKVSRILNKTPAYSPNKKKCNK